MSFIKRRELQSLLDKRLSFSEIQEIVFELEYLQWDNIPGGDVKNARIRGLLEECERRHRMQDLIQVLARVRPDIIKSNTQYRYPRWPLHRAGSQHILLILGLLGLGSIASLKLWLDDSSPITILLISLALFGICLSLVFIISRRRLVSHRKGRRGGQISVKRVAYYPAWVRAMAEVLLVLFLFSTTVGLSRWQIARTQRSREVVILVANFDGQDPQKYRVTETIVTRLQEAVKRYRDVQIESLGRPIKEVDIDPVTGQTGSAAARTVGEQHHASIVIWGWYGMTGDTVPLSVHFEIVRDQHYLPPLTSDLRGEPILLPQDLLTNSHFHVQTVLSQRMAYLTLLTLGLARYEVEDWQGAVQYLNEAIDQIADLPVPSSQSYAYILRGTARALAGNHSAAITDLDKAIELENEQPLYSSYAFAIRGAIHGWEGDYKQAIYDLDKAIGLDPKLDPAYMLRAMAHYSLGHYDSAIDNLNHGITLRPDPYAYYLRGNVFVIQGECAKAVSDYTEAIGLNPELDEVYRQRGTAHLALAHYSQAIADFNRFLKENPKDATAYANRAVAYHHLQDDQLALTDLGHAIRLEAGVESHYYNRASIYYDSQDYDRALEDLDRAISIEATYAAYSMRCLVYYRKDKLDEAIDDCTAAIALDNTKDIAFFDRGLVYQKKKDVFKAINDYKEVVELTHDTAIKEAAQMQLQELGVTN